MRGKEHEPPAVRHAIVKGDPASSDSLFIGSEGTGVEDREEGSAGDVGEACQGKIRFAAGEEALIRQGDTLEAEG